MRSKKILIISLIVTFILLYFLMFSFLAIWISLPVLSELMSEVSQNPALLLSPDYFGVTIITIILSAAWIFTLIKLLGSAEDFFNKRMEERQELSKIDREVENLNIFNQTAEKEFMKRKISQETFKQVQVMTGKKMVELKSRKKRLSKERAESKSS